MSTKKSTTIPQTLHGTRERVADLKAELAEVRRAGLPAQEVEDSLRAALTQAERHFERLIDGAGRAMAAGQFVGMSDLTDHQSDPKNLVWLALGGVVHAVGQHRIVALAKERAGSLEGPVLRMPSRERRERLEQLTRELYEAEMLEETIRERDGTERRPDADALPLLGVPYSVCVDHGLLRGES